MVAMLTFLLMVCGGLMPEITFASESGDYSALLGTWQGYLSIVLFVLAYVFVVMEEKIHMRKSKPVLVGAGLIFSFYTVIVSIIMNIAILLLFNFCISSYNRFAFSVSH
jgi:hypothetical protein